MVKLYLINLFFSDVNNLSGTLNDMNLQNARLSCREGYSGNLLESELSKQIIRPRPRRKQNHKLNPLNRNPDQPYVK